MTLDAICIPASPCCLHTYHLLSYIQAFRYSCNAYPIFQWAQIIHNYKDFTHTAHRCAQWRPLRSVHMLDTCTGDLAAFHQMAHAAWGKGPFPLQARTCCFMITKLLITFSLPGGAVAADDLTLASRLLDTILCLSWLTLPHAYIYSQGSCSCSIPWHVPQLHLAIYDTTLNVAWLS